MKMNYTWWAVQVEALSAAHSTASLRSAAQGGLQTEPPAEILSEAKELFSDGTWWAVQDSNLSRFAGVSEAGARRRNPERREGPQP